MKVVVNEATGKAIYTQGTENTFFLIGLLNEFMNRYQAVADRFFEEISWKQCFVLICLGLFQEPPNLKELSEVMGSSHQNVKQMLNKLEKAGYVMLVKDEKDKRNQRILLTEKAQKFSKEHDEGSAACMKQLFQTVDAKSLQITIDTIMKMDDQLKIIQSEGRFF